MGSPASQDLPSFRPHPPPIPRLESPTERHSTTVTRSIPLVAAALFAANAARPAATPVDVPNIRNRQ